MIKRNKRGKQPNYYPLPDKTVLYSHKKHLEPIPEIGKKYHCFDDGKIRFSRHYLVEILEVLGQMAFKKKYPELFRIWLIESKSTYWLYSRSIDKFIVTKSLNEYSNYTEVFVRTKQGGWFSVSKSSLCCGELDFFGEIWKELISDIDRWNYTKEEKERIIRENTI